MKRSPLKRKTPLRSRAVMPKAKHSERTAHLGRMKRKRVSKTASEKRHLERVAKMPCCVTGRRPVVVHHLMVAPDKRTRRDHRWVVPVLPELHNGTWFSIHGIGCERKFELHHGLLNGYLVTFARALWAASEREEGK